MNQPKYLIALFHWGDLIEDFLDTINISFEAFCQEMTGGWMFGYIEALKGAGTSPILFCISSRVTQVEYHTHYPTGTPIYVLPAPGIYRYLRQSMKNPAGWTIREMFGAVSPLKFPYLALIKHSATYLATPRNLLAEELKRFREVH